jgi:hypothetical protein
MDAGFLAAAPKEMLQIGCSVSMNAYGEAALSVDGESCPIRSAGGHMHFSSIPFSNGPDREYPHVFWQQAAPEIVKTMDVLLGLPSVIMADGVDDPRRRMFYGRAGEYRLPVHGLEYRVLSNFWLAHPVLSHTVWEWARVCYTAGLAGIRRYLPVTDEEVREAINQSNAVLAKALWQRVEPLAKLLLPCAPPSRYHGAIGERMMHLLTASITKTVPNLDDFMKNWPVEGWVQHSNTKNCSIANSEWYRASIATKDACQTKI